MNSSAGAAAPRSAFHWRYYPDRTQLQEQIARASRVPSLVARLLVNRGIHDATEIGDFLRPSFSGLSDPFAMKPMERAVERLLRAIQAREPIVVYGDSDVDGVCGTALLAGFLRKVGADVSTYIPNRLVEGYSLTERGVAAILARNARVVLTVDNGTTATARIAELAGHGIDVIVADHHEPSRELPPALALLNPKLPDNGYPFPYLCGTGVAFQLLAALATRIPARGGNQDAIQDLLRHSIAFVAMATICDCVPLQRENRILARLGLNALAETTHPGLSALLSIAGVGRAVRSDDVSFRIGPRINAAGRLGVADRALALLLADRREDAEAIARELDQRNGERQALEADIFRSARQKAIEASDDPIFVLADESWHAGVVGIVAARIATEFHRPTVLIALKDGRGRGSGRSVRRFDLHRALGACSQHLVGFGGHAFAAGLEIEAHKVADLRRALIEASQQGLAESAGQGRELLIDAELPIGLLTPSLMHDLDRLAPYGEGLASPIFAAPDLVVDGTPRLVGKGQNHLSFVALQSGAKVKAIAYGASDRAPLLQPGRRFSVAFTPRLSLFRGRASVEMDVKDFAVA